MFSKACEYGTKAMIFIAQRSDSTKEHVSLKEIARETNSPVAFMAKVLQILTRADLLYSSKGPAGGFILSRNSKDVYLADIVKAIDGNKVFTGCGLGLDECNAKKPCPVHSRFAVVRNELSNMLHTSTLQELAKGLKEGSAFLIR